MTSLRVQATDSFEEGIGVGVFPTGGDAHAGVFFLDEDDQPRVLHLAFHASLEFDELDEDWQRGVWAAPAIPRERAEAIGALCDRVHRRHKDQGLSYALKYLAGTFEIGTGEVRLGPSCCGFTCSTFVLALFRSAGVTLLRQEEWRARSGDRERQQRLVALLRRHHKSLGIADDHIQRVEDEVGCVRFSPVDVVAGASLPLPAGFDDVVALRPTVWTLLGRGAAQIP